ncbi:MAG: hypothetical protein SV487_13265 [Thermodesulfobacteriota bacterium]|nr:hypothetical protein [Thermodesulfobacteriota bacterium]
MELGQKVGTAIVMLIPTVVGAIYCGEALDNWTLVVIWIAIMPIIYWAIITGKLSRSKQK